MPSSSGTPTPVLPGVETAPTNGKLRQCKATKSSGERCNRAPIKGGMVCAVHGGAAPQVKHAAQMRLLNLIEPAIATLAREMVQAEKSADRQRAANSILDRAGVPRTTNAPDPEAARQLLIDRLKAMREERNATLVDTDEATVELLDTAAEAALDTLAETPPSTEEHDRT